jgi:hypothetical protein
VKPPRRIRVGPVTYEVTSDALAVAEMGHDKLGETQDDFARIVLHPKQSPAVRRVSLMHELLHAVNEHTGLDDSLGDKVEEDVTNRIAPALLDTFRRNPKLVAYLMEDA